MNKGNWIAYLIRFYPMGSNFRVGSLSTSRLSVLHGHPVMLRSHIGSEREQCRHPGD